MTRIPSLMFLSLVLALAGACGDDDASGTDAGTRVDSGNSVDSGSGGTDSGNGGTDSGNGGTDSGTDGAVADGGDTDASAATCPDLDPSQGADAVIISQIDLANDRVEFYNPTDTSIDLDGLVLCQRPQYQTLSGTGVSVPAGGYAWLDDLGMVDFAETGAGELAIYTNTMYTNRDSMLDFVCWDGMRGPTQTRLDTAEDENGDGEVLWSGACAGAPASDVVRRLAGNDGDGAASYDVAGGVEPHACPTS